VAKQKTVSRQLKIGEAGIALIERRALEMGHVFHPRRVDYGIDGHLDLVEPGTGVALNLAMLVQSKASDSRFPDEDDDGFHYLCDLRDLDMWLAGNAPVLLVFSHPNEAEAWWVEVKSAFPDARTRATRRLDVNKHTQRFDRTAGEALLRLAVPANSGLYLRPAPRTELLTSNLLPVISMPKVLNVAPAAVGSYPEAGEALAGRSRRREPAWILTDGMVLSFSDLTDPLLAPLCAGPPERHETADWAGSDDTDTIYKFASLLGRTVQRAHPQLRWHKERGHLHWKASPDLTPVKVSTGRSAQGRTVFGPKKVDSSGKPGFYAHAAVSLRMRRLGPTWYCEIVPDYCFTSDGAVEHRNAEKLIAGIKRLDRHPAVRAQVHMWARVLQGKAEDLFTDHDAPEAQIGFGDLLDLTVDTGIDDRHWGPAPGNALAEPHDAHSDEPEVNDHIFDEDLLSLLDDEPAAPIPPAVEQPQTSQPRQRPAGRAGRPSRAR
jgi:Domain of unknown function (DUF4365)